LTEVVLNPSSALSCGDGICNGSETHATCPADCPHYTQINTPLSGRFKDSSLVGYWSFDGPSMNSGQALDSSGNNNTGTLYGGVKKVPGINGQALSFDGVDDYVDINDSFPTGNSQRTISFWFKTDSFCIAEENCASGDMFAYDYGGDPGLSFEIVAQNNAVALSFYSHTVITPQYALSAQTWYHVAVVVPSGATLTSNVLAYINGSLQTLSTISGSSQTLNTLSSDISIGARQAGGGSHDLYYNGLIDEVRIYNRALSASEIAEQYAAGAAKMKVNTPITQAGPQSGLVGNWTFNGQDMGTTSARDLSGNNNTGWLINGPKKVPGINGQALSFDGVDDYVALPAFDDMPDHSVSAWIFPRSDGADDAGRITDILYREYWCVNNELSNTVRLYGESWSYDTSGITQTSTVIPLKSWSHVVYTLSDSGDKKIHIYINGQEASYTTQTAGSGGRAGNDFIWAIGQRIGYDQFYFDGLIDEVRVYNRALSADEIQQLYRLRAMKITN